MIRPGDPPSAPALWREEIVGAPLSGQLPGAPILIGVLRGEGIGPEVIDCALEVLTAAAAAGGFKLDVEYGGATGRPAELQCGAALSPSVSEFCGDIFARGGTLLCGPGGGRFVYDLRARFDLYCKLSPIVVPVELADSGLMRPGHSAGVDILVIREGAAGLYQGEWELTKLPGAGRLARHTFSYTEDQVRRIIRAATRIARGRRRELTVIHKESGAPSISTLWRDCATEIAAAHGVNCRFLDVDYAGYRLLQHPREFDVVVAPNLFGDILSDLGGVLLGSRALTYGGNFSAQGNAFYQTNHGAAYDLAGRDQANPIGQILSAAMLLRESYGQATAAAAIHAAVRSVWRAGWRTADLTGADCRLAGTRQMGTLVAEAVQAHFRAAH